MRRCRHRTVICSVWDAGWVQVCAMNMPGCYDLNVCAACGATIPLGRASDTLATTEEIRAAEMASTTNVEALCLMAEHARATFRFKAADVLELALCIATHEGN